MTQTSPPGWHPDPGYTGFGPIQERWWDGSQWTDHLRVPPATARSRRIRIGAGITAGVVLLAAIGGGVYLLADDSGKKTDTATAPSASPSPAPSRQPGAPGGSGGDGGGNESPEQQQPQTEDGYATDLASGISIPVPDGWKGESGMGAGVTTGSYACPGDTKQKCVRGGVFSVPAKALKLNTTTARATAEKDIAANAKDSYGEQIYGGITSHQELKSEPVTVMRPEGLPGALEGRDEERRRRVRRVAGLPRPRAENMLVVVRSGFDINTKAPALSVLDDITKGIKAASGTGSGPGTTA